METVLLLPGDGIGPEVIASAQAVLETFIRRERLGIELLFGIIGGESLDRFGVPIRTEELNRARGSRAVLLGAVGGPKWDSLPMELRPEKALLNLRKALDVYANLRPVRAYTSLLPFSTLKPEVITGVDLIVVRELVSGIYFGTPRGTARNAEGFEEAWNTERYTEVEIRRVAEVAFQLARRRKKKVTSVDKANILETSVLWRKVVTDLKNDRYPDILLEHMYVDNAAMQLVRRPRDFDILVTSNMFGDILSDEAAILTGSIGMLSSASIGAGPALYEPIHGSAPDIAGKGIANPMATILSVGLMLELSFDRNDLKEKIEKAVSATLEGGIRTPDLNGTSTTEEVTKAIIRNLEV
jgi:3-isopropylmalate dehydrogenase